MKNLILIGLIALAFVTSIQLGPIVYQMSLTEQEAKEFLSIIFCTMIIIYSLFKGQMIRFINIPCLALLGYLIISPFYAPPFHLAQGSLEKNDLWIYKPLLHSIIYVITFICISCYRWKRQEIIFLIKGIALTGFVMSCYIIIQAMRVDQFFVIPITSHSLASTQVHLTGTIGNAAWAGAFIILTIPFAIYLRMFLPAAIMISVTFLLKSQMATWSLILGLMLYSGRYLIFGSWKVIFAVFLILIILGSLVIFSPKALERHIFPNGRINLWKQAIKTWYAQSNIINIREGMGRGQKLYYSLLNQKKFTLFGYGMNAYRNYLAPKAGLPKGHLENEWLEAMCNIGIVGMLLFLASVLWILGKLVVDNSLLAWTFLTSLFITCVNSLGEAVWQIEPSRFYSLIIAGLATSYIMRGKYAECR